MEGLRDHPTMVQVIADAPRPKTSGGALAKRRGGGASVSPGMKQKRFSETEPVSTSEKGFWCQWSKKKSFKGWFRTKKKLQFNFFFVGVPESDIRAETDLTE